MSESILQIGAAVDIGALKSGFDEATAIVNSSAGEMSESFQAMAAESQASTQKIEASWIQAAQSSVTYLKAKDQLRAATRAAKQAEDDDTTALLRLAEAKRIAAEASRGLEMAEGAASAAMVAEAATASNVSSAASRNALKGIEAELGIKAPKFVNSFLSNLGGVGPVLSKAFAPIAVIGLVEVLSQVPEAIQQCVDKLRGWNDDAKTQFAEIRQNAAKTRLEVLNQAEAFRATSEIGKTGLEKVREQLSNLRTDTAINRAETDKYTAALAKANAVINKKDKLVSKPPGADLPDTYSAAPEIEMESTHVEVEQAKIDAGVAKGMLESLAKKNLDFETKLHQLQAEEAAQIKGDAQQAIADADRQIQQLRRQNTLDSLKASPLAQTIQSADTAVADTPGARKGAMGGEQLLKITREAQEELKKWSASVIDEGAKAYGEMMTGERQLFEVETHNRGEVLQADVQNLNKNLEGINRTQEEERKAGQVILQGKLQRDKQALEAEQQSVEESYALNEISAKERLRLLDQIAQKSYQVERQILADELSASADKPVEYARVLNQLNALDVKRVIDHAASIKKMHDLEIQSVKDVATQTTAAFSNGLNSWLQKQKTFADAMKDTWNSIAMIAIQSIEKMAEKWVLETLIMGAAKKLLGIIEEETDTESAAVSSAANVAEATSNAAVAASGALAATAAIPIVGPELAPAAAMAMYSVGMGFASMAAFAGGGIVPKTDIALLHKDEMVLPAHISKSVQQMADGGGGNGADGGAIHVHFAPQVQAFDSRGVDAVLDRHQGKFLDMLRGAVRNGRLR